MLNHYARLVRYPLSNVLRILHLILGCQMEAAIRRMIVIMMDANHISKRLASMRQEISDLGTSNARYWSKSSHTALDKSASALRRDRLVQIKLELSDMMKRCA